MITASFANRKDPRMRPGPPTLTIRDKAGLESLIGG
jgi:hypothetical protein